MPLLPLRSSSFQQNHCQAPSITNLKAPPEASIFPFYRPIITDSCFLNNQEITPPDTRRPTDIQSAAAPSFIIPDSFRTSARKKHTMPNSDVTAHLTNQEETHTDSYSTDSLLLSD
ncbi:hypothetical protein TNIN_173921 [Trichonephila inaurata madagascariensis]|uniref:Uncharacterized protein n=1 Tax=Trichonephila inaurata madagascariensis TaxID=2747483 RepID=A0A8X6YPP8_9ARAC|nr:hypothetical protein TNIN_318981 [Trichonephila inaurata madagascariensis]GFY76193.1 hypothetical protein TNIN_173921 [Trichonephila inaurata madagascariensis]